MNLVYGEIAAIFKEEGMQMGSVRVAGALKKVPLDLVTDARCGDKILLCDGVAISKVNAVDENKGKHVSRDSR